MEFSQEIFRALGMTLVHSIWQGAVVAAIVLFLLGMAKKSNARFRYLVTFTGLMMLLAGFIITFMLVYRNNHVVNEIKNSFSSLHNAGNPVPWPITPASMATKIFGILEPFYPALAMGWLIGFLIMSFRMTGSVLISRISFRKGLQHPDPMLNDLFTSVQNELHMNLRVKLLITYRMISPMVIGFLQPMVVIPAAAVTGLSVDQIKAVMVHELAHIKRLDHIFIIIQAIAQQVLFFHPVAWFLIKEIDRERENCCDDRVILTNNNPINYIKALAMIQELNLQVSASNALTGKSNQLLNRIKRLIKPELRHSAAFRMSVILLFIATMSVSAMALIISEQHSVKNSGSSAEMQQQKNSEESFIIEDQDGDKKKMKIVYENDTIKEMTVNGKRLSQEEMKEYAEEIRKMHLEMEASREELARMHEQLNEARMQLEMSGKHLQDTVLMKSHIPFAWEQELLGELAWPEMDGENFRKFGLNEELQGKIWENNEKFILDLQSEEFRKSMEKAREDAMEAYKSDEYRENLKKAQEEVMKAFQKHKLQQKEYWDQQQDGFREEMKKAREHARKAFEEMKKNHPDWNYEINPDDVVPFYLPGVPDMDAFPEVPDMHLAPGFPGIPELPVIPGIEGTPEVNIVPDAELAPEVELAPEAPEPPDAPGISEEEELTPEKSEPSERSLDTLKELEEE